MVAQAPFLNDRLDTSEEVSKKRLELILDHREQEYLPSVSEVGFSILIQTPGTAASPTSDAVFAPPGFTTYIGLTLDCTQTCMQTIARQLCRCYSRRWPIVRTKTKEHDVPVCETNEQGKCCVENILRKKDLSDVRGSEVGGILNEPKSKSPAIHREKIKGGNKTACLYRDLPGRKIKEICKCFRTCL
ncbi:hypothetical protein MTO96_030227 [Rhipicephalus appendiculatus]